MTQPTSDLQPVSYRELIRANANFRWLWGGQIVSLLGDWFNTIASVALVTSLTDSGLAIGGLFVLRMLAPFFTSPLAGVLADRYSRKGILIAADLVRGAIVLGMLAVRSADTVWLLYVLTSLQLATSSFFFTARTAILPDIVEPRALGAANAVTSATWSVMLAIGAALGGVVAGSLGVYAAFLIDAGTFFVSALLVARIQSPPPASDDRRFDPAAFTAQYRDGLRYLVHHPDILAIALHKSALTVLFGTTYRVVQAAIAERAFPLGQQGGTAMGLLFAAAGVGTGVGPVAVRAMTGDNPWRLRWAIVGGYVIGSLGLLISTQLTRFDLLLAGAFLSGIGNGILWVFSSQLLFQLVEPQVRGRVFSSEFAMFTLASAGGSAAVGAAIDTSMGIAGVLVAMALLSWLPAGAWSLWLLALRSGHSPAGRNRGNGE